MKKHIKFIWIFLVLSFALIVRISHASAAVTTIPEDKVVYVKTGNYKSQSCGGQQYDQYIVEADYPGGANETILPLTTNGVPGLLGGTYGCFVAYPPPSTPVVSPDREKIALTRNGNVTVYYAATHTESSFLYSPGLGNTYDPKWSPDGKYLSTTGTVCVSGGSCSQGLYLWDPQTLSMIKSMSFPSSLQVDGSYQWLPDSSGIVLASRITNSKSPDYISCQIGTSSYNPGGLYSFNITTQSSSTILAPTCNTDWMHIQGFAVSESGIIAFIGEGIGSNQNGLRSTSQHLDKVNGDGTNVQAIPISLWEMDTIDGYFCGESMSFPSWEIDSNDIEASVEEPNSTHTYCDTNEQPFNHIERINTDTGTRQTVQDESSNGFNTYFATSARVSDMNAPSITHTLSPATNSNGWNNTDVTVSFNCSDDTAVASCSGPTTLTNEGANQAVTGTAVDTAGNTAATTATVNIDKTAPTISYSATPTPNINGWNQNDVLVTFNCDDALSGIATCTSPITVSSEGGNQTVTGTATDKAGNTATVTATVNLDKTAPIISYTTSPLPNTDGWNNSDVNVAFTCNDDLSGVDICPGTATLSGEGGGQIITGTATDKAGNLATASALVNIDKTAPAVAIVGWSADPVQQGQDTTLIAEASDGLSGVYHVDYSINGGPAQPMSLDPISGDWIVTFGSTLPANTYSVTVTATDQAGNTSSGANDILAVYTTSNGYVTGHAKVQPSSSDTMPIALDTSKNPANLVLGFTNVTAPMSGSFDMDYSIKNNQNEFSLSSTYINWVVVPDNTHSSILGHADLTTYVNGIKTITQDVAVRFDITVGTNGAADNVSIKIYNPDLNPNTDNPSYQIADQVEPNGSNLMIHP